MKTYHIRQFAFRVFGHSIFLAFGIVYMYPFLWMIASSLKTKSEFFKNGLSLFSQQVRWNNYAEAWASAKFSIYFSNTLFVSIMSTALIILITSMAGYVLARKKFPGKRVLVGIMLATLFLPRGYTIIPIFEIVKAFNLLNTLWAVIIVNVGTSVVFNTFLFAGYFVTLPKELEDSATLDGANFPQVYLHIAIR